MLPRAPALFGLVCVLGACSTNPAPSPSTQALVDELAARNPDIVRLTVHQSPSGGGASVAVASTLASKRGKPSDPEDLQALASGRNVVLQEPGAIDVTVPILPRNGKHTAVAGVTLKAAAGARQEALVARAEAIAQELARAIEANAEKR
jgi:hypothetical protein